MKVRGHLHDPVALTSAKVFKCNIWNNISPQATISEAPNKDNDTESCTVDFSQEENDGNLNFVSHVAR
jgi:hypothetical protein